MAGDDVEDTELLRLIQSKAERFLAGHRWCRSIRESYFGLGVGGVVGVFLFRLDPTEGGDEWLWVVAGDLPSAYLVIDEAPTPLVALEIYCELMEDWVGAVKEGRSGEEIFPVAAAATRENAEMLASRIRFLRDELMPAFVEE